MTIFQLAVYSCVVLNGYDGELVSKTCRWDARDMFVSRGGCEEAGRAELGRPIFSDIADNRKVERHRCTTVSVRD